MNAPLAPPFPSNPSIGEFYGNWVWNGVQWVCSPAAGVRVNCQVFLQSGPYMPSNGLVSAVVTCIGGGGGGGGIEIGNLSNPQTYALAGGGGGSGGLSQTTLAAALVAGGVQVTIGAGGAAGAQGGAGGTTSFGAMCVAYGGAGGQLNDAGGTSNWGYGGQGAQGGVGDLTWPGAAGDVGLVQFFPNPVFCAVAGGMGGHMLGGSTGSYIATGGWDPGKDGQPFTGAGGSGAVVNQLATGTQGPGGAGGSGLCYVMEYCWADTGTGDCVNPPLNVNARVAVTHVPWTGPGPCPPGWGQGGPYSEFEGE